MGVTFHPESGVHHRLVEMTCDWFEPDPHNKTVTWYRERPGLSRETLWTFGYFGRYEYVSEEKAPNVDAMIWTDQQFGHGRFHTITLNTTRKDAGVYWCVMQIYGKMYESQREELIVHG